MQSRVDTTTALHQAALSGNVRQVKTLAEQEANFNQQLLSPDSNDNLPLDRACPRGHYEIVSMLVAAHKKPGCEYVMHNKQNYYPFLSTVRWYLKALDGEVSGYGRFNSQKNFSKDYMNIIHLLAKEYPDHMLKSDNKGCNALVYAINHFNNACIEKNASKIERIKVLLQFLIDSKIPVQKNKIYHNTWKNVATDITAMEKQVIERENIKPQNNSSKKPSFFDSQKVVNPNQKPMISKSSAGQTHSNNGI